MPEVEGDFAGERGKPPQVVSDGSARYRDQETLAGLNVETFELENVIRVVPRRRLFVPDVDEEFFVFQRTMDNRP